MSSDAATDRVTLAEIAAEAGVSLSTMLNVLNGRADVATATRRVEQVFAERGYRRRGAEEVRVVGVRSRGQAAAAGPGPPGSSTTAVAVAAVDVSWRPTNESGASSVERVPPEGDSKVARAFAERHPVVTSCTEGVPLRIEPGASKSSRQYVDDGVRSGTPSASTPWSQHATVRICGRAQQIRRGAILRPREHPRVDA